MFFVCPFVEGGQNNNYRGNSAPRGQRGAPRGHSARGRGASHTREPIKFEGEFDFEKSNAEFDKEQIERELKEKLTLGRIFFFPRNT